MYKAFRIAAVMMLFMVMKATGAPLDFSIDASAAGSNQQLVLNALFEPAAADDGKTGSLYIWALNNSNWYFLTATGWQSWNNEEMPRAYHTGALTRQTLPILEGDLDVSGLAGTGIYVGYGLNLQDMLSGSKYRKIYTIRESDSPLLGGGQDEVPPVTGPGVSGTTETSTTFSVAIDSDGTGYYLVRPAGDAAPSVTEVIAANHSFAMTANALASVNISGLTPGTAYKIYFAAKDGVGNAQADVGVVNVTTVAATPPVTTAGPSVWSTTDSSTSLSVKIDKNGTGYYLVQGADQAAPTVSAVIAANQSFAMTANVSAMVSISGLVSRTTYKIYFVAKDVLGSVQAAVQSVTVTTLPPIRKVGSHWFMPITFISTWPDANYYCRNYRGLGSNAWRLPTRDELNQLFNTLALNEPGWQIEYTWSSTYGKGDGNSSYWYYLAVFFFNQVQVGQEQLSKYGVTCIL